MLPLPPPTPRPCLSLYAYFCRLDGLYLLFEGNNAPFLFQSVNSLSGCYGDRHACVSKLCLFRMFVNIFKGKLCLVLVQLNPPLGHSMPILKFCLSFSLSLSHTHTLSLFSLSFLSPFSLPLFDSFISLGIFSVRIQPQWSMTASSYMCVLSSCLSSLGLGTTPNVQFLRPGPRKICFMPQKINPQNPGHHSSWNNSMEFNSFLTNQSGPKMRLSNTGRLTCVTSQGQL